MSYKINYLDNKAIVTFTNIIEEKGITKAFLEIVDTISIEKLNYIIFDCANVITYTIPADYMTRVKVLTHFSTSWNPNIAILFITTHPEIISMVTGFINHNDDLKWGYYLFDDMRSAKKVFLKI